MAEHGKISAEQAEQSSRYIADRITRRDIMGWRYAANLQRRVLENLQELEAELLERLARHDVNGRVLGIGRLQRLQRLLDETRDEIGKAYQRIEALSRAELGGLAKVEVEAMAGVIGQAGAVVGISLQAALPTDIVMSALTRQPLVLGSPLSGWWSRQEQATIDAFAREMRLSTMAGETVGDMIRRVRGGMREGVMLKGVMDTSRRTAETLVRTSVASVQNNARVAVYDANLDVIEAFAHLSRLDSRTSDVCIARAGKRWDARTREPIDHSFPFQNPPLHPRCRSVLTPLVIGAPPMEFEGADAWVRGLSTDEQDELLGKGRAELFRQGRIEVRDLVDQTNRPITLREMRDRPATG